MSPIKSARALHTNHSIHPYVQSISIVLLFHHASRYISHERPLPSSDIRDICGEAALAWATEQTIRTDSTEITGGYGVAKLSLSSRHFDSALLDVKLGGRESSLPEARSFFNGFLTDLQRRYPQSHDESVEDLKRQAKVNLEKGSEPEA